MKIAHNIQAMSTKRQYGITTKSLAKISEKLSTGYRINKAADDAAGLSISEKMRKQIRGLSQASANAEDGISMVQIADGAMAEVHEMIDRGLELSVKAANGVLSYTDRCTIQEEINQIKLEIDSVKERTKFNEIYVLKGDIVETTEQIPAGVANSGGTMPSWITFGSAIGDGFMSETYTTQNTFVIDTTVNPPVEKTVGINHSAASIDFSNVTTTNVNDLVGTGFNMTCCTCSDYYSVEFISGSPSTIERSGTNYIYKINIDGVTSANELITRIIGGTDNGYPNGHYTKLTADSANPSRLVIFDDRSKEDKQTTVTSDWIEGKSSWKDWIPKNQLYGVRASTSWGQFGEGVMREQQQSVVNGYYEIPHSIILQIGADSDNDNRMRVLLPVISSRALGIDEVDVRSDSEATEGIEAFHAAKDYVSKERSRMGSYQNRLEHTIKNLDNVVENTTAAESRIRDTDMSTAMVEYSLLGILAQVGESIIAQANQCNQLVLSLIS